MAFLKSVIYIAILGVLAHFVGEAVPRRWFVWSRFPYRAYKWEREGKIYDVLRIRAWKDRVPDMSRVMRKMVPKRVGKCPKSAEVWRLVQETCVAEITHIVLCILSLGVWLFWQNTVGVILSAVAVVCNIPFILIQRYNRPTLVALAKRLELREERKKNASSHTVG